jgi:hypothetical protein
MPISNADLPRIGQLLLQCVRAVEDAKVKIAPEDKESKAYSDWQATTKNDFDNAYKAFEELLTALTPSAQERSRRAFFTGEVHDEVVGAPSVFDRCLNGADVDILEAELDAKVSEKLLNLWEFFAAHPGAPFAARLYPERERRKTLKRLTKLALWFDSLVNGGSDPGTTPARMGQGTDVKPKRRGRRPDTDPKKDEHIASAWKAGHHKTYADLGREMHLTAKQIEEAIDRNRKRESRKTR